MSTTKTPIHMRLYTLGFWYSRNRRNGQSRIQALRGAWAMLRPLSFNMSGAIVGGGFTISAPSAQTDMAARIDVLRPKEGDTIALTYPGHLSAEQFKRIEEQVSPLVPDGVKAMVLDGGASLTHVAAPSAE